MVYNLTGFESDAMANVYNNMPANASFMMDVGGRWVVRDQTTGEEIDAFPAMTNVIPAPIIGDHARNRAGEPCRVSRCSRLPVGGPPAA